MKTLVTGHHGYIGSVLAPMLREAGHDVVGLDTFYYRGCDLGDHSRASSPHSRSTSGTCGRQTLEGFDAVVHLAALSNDPLGDLDADWTYAINLDGTLSLARAAKEAGVARFVFASSCSMYGAAEGDDSRRRGRASSSAHRRMRSPRSGRRRGCASSPETGSRPSRCGTRPRTVRRPGSGSTSSSTISSPGRTRRGRSAC